jgi:hypothetical protein
MPVMAVNNENQQEQTGDYRSRPRWSAGKKTDAVLRLLRGEPLETLSRELGVEAHWPSPSHRGTRCRWKWNAVCQAARLVAWTRLILAGPSARRIMPAICTDAAIAEPA